MVDKWTYPIPPPRDFTDFGSWVGELTKPRNAQADFARGIDLKPQHIGRWKKDGARPEKENLERIASYLGVSYVDLLRFWETDLPEFPSKRAGHGSRSDPAGVISVPLKGAISPSNGGFWMDKNIERVAGRILWHPAEPEMYAYQVLGDELFPRVRGGEFVIVDPRQAVNPGDETLLKLADGRYAILQLVARAAGILSFQRIGVDHRPVTLREAEVIAMHAITGIAKPAHRVEPERPLQAK